MMGLNNIELISDRPIEDNLREMAEVKKRYPRNTVIASLMVESKREVWHDIVKRAEDAGADGLELNFGCPHGMSERGMGSAVGQVPEYSCMITEWVKEAARTPVMIKLTPNISDIRTVARAAKKGGADALSAINTINSITGIDLDTLTPRPNVGVIVAGEPGGSVPATRAHISTLWRGARVVDHHGMTEIGPVSYGCPKRPGVLHIVADSYIPEVIDPLTLQPVSRGVTGELVLTNLGRLGSPLIRYRTSDIVRAATEDRCVCGTGDLALEGGILGRTDDMLLVRGVNVYPAAVENILRGFEVCGRVPRRNSEPPHSA